MNTGNGAFGCARLDIDADGQSVIGVPDGQHQSALPRL
jgi:hypothetical protein